MYDPILYKPIFAWDVPLVSLIFLKTPLVFPILLFSLFLCIDHWGRLSYVFSDDISARIPPSLSCLKHSSPSWPEAETLSREVDWGSTGGCPLAEDCLLSVEKTHGQLHLRWVGGCWAHKEVAGTPTEMLVNWSPTELAEKLPAGFTETHSSFII